MRALHVERMDGTVGENHRPPVVVAGAFQTGVVLMRDLAQHGIRTFCVDCDSSKQGFRSVYGQAFLCPNPDSASAAWADYMCELAEMLGDKPVLIPSSDMFVSAIAEHVETLKNYYTLRTESVATQALLATKEKQYELAEANGLRVPRTATIANVEQLREFAAQATFPCLIKPLHFREWRLLERNHPLLNQKVAIADTPTALEQQYASVASVTPIVVLQEIIAGPDTAKLVYLSCYGRGGRRLGSCIVREIRVTPIFFGSASVTAPVEDLETEAMCDAFFQSIQYEGFCELELKRDVRDGKVRLIEANPRYSVTADAATHAGVELGWLYYRDIVGEASAPPVRWNGRQFHHVVLQRDVECFRDYLSRGLTTWKEIRESYRFAVFFDFDSKDRRLAWETVQYLLKELAYPIYRRLFFRGKKS